MKCIVRLEMSEILDSRFLANCLSTLTVDNNSPEIQDNCLLEK